jgi:hypothetical protein
MALIGNYSVLQKTFARFDSGTSVSNLRSNYNKTGQTFNRFTAQGHQSRSAIVAGTSPPYSWALARKPGGIASNFNMNGLGALTASGISARRGVATIDGVGSLTASLGVITPLASSIAGIGSFVSAVSAVSSLASAMTSSGSVSSGLSLRVPLSSAITSNGSVAGTFGGTARIEADITPFTELSPKNLAAAVWDEQASDHVEDGTFGAKANKNLSVSQFLALK